MMKRAVKWLLAAVVLLILAGAAMLARRGSTPRIHGPSAVAELRQLSLGGDPQWVLIRGQHRCNPVVLFLHGGPGMPTMFLAHDFQRDWEKYLTVVQWDRLGAGKSYAAGLAYDSFTVRRTLDDTHALASWLRKRFDVPGVVLVGHSWGSYIGMRAIAERPDLYLAYVGTGQLAGSREARARARAAELRPLAQARGDTALLQMLEHDQTVPENTLFRYHGELVKAHSFLPILLTGLRAREYTLHDVLDVGRGAQRVGRLMRGDDVPLDSAVRKVRVPVYFFLGRHDMNTPPATAVSYLQQLDAPEKGIRWFDSSAHFPFWEESARFGNELRGIADEVHGAAPCRLAGG